MRPNRFMTKPYKIFSRAYRIVLGLFAVGFLIVSAIFPENNRNDSSGIWALLFSILTVTAITIFHTLEKDNKYKTLFQVFVCALVFVSLAFVIFLLFTGEDGNLLIHAVFLITIFVNTGLLFYLIQDKKYNHNR